jgi:hypothetical protein
MNGLAGWRSLIHPPFLQLQQHVVCCGQGALFHQLSYFTPLESKESPSISGLSFIFVTSIGWLQPHLQWIQNLLLFRVGLGHLIELDIGDFDSLFTNAPQSFDHAFEGPYVRVWSVRVWSDHRKPFQPSYLLDLKRIEKRQLKRQAKWTEALAVGSQSFVETMEGRVHHRQRLETEEDGGMWVGPEK